VVRATVAAGKNPMNLKERKIQKKYGSKDRNVGGLIAKNGIEQNFIADNHTKNQERTLL